MRFDDLSVFVIEDDALVAMNLEDMLMDLGCRVAGTAMRFDQLGKLLSGETACDVVILDVNIGGEKIFPYAEKLRARAMPMIFATGYGQSGLPAEWRDYPVLQKPYNDDEVAQALTLALTPASGAATAQG